MLARAARWEKLVRGEFVKCDVPFEACRLILAMHGEWKDIPWIRGTKPLLLSGKLSWNPDPPPDDAGDSS
jgi:hypothetical protein